MNQPELPSLPPMPSATPSQQAEMPQPLSGNARSQSNTVAPMGGKRLRQMLTVFATGSIGLVALLGVGQLVLRPGLRPTDLIAIFEAQTEISIFNQRLGVEPGKVEFTEDQYRAKIAEAERAGQAKAEVAFQKELAVVQADKERVVGAYQTLYQRTNIIAQAAVQMESIALQFRQRLIEQTNGGRVITITVYDAACGFGFPDACEKARQIREGMIAESSALTEGNVARKVNSLMADIPDPASFVVQEDRRRHGAPHIER
ncbi:hypothetical protein OOT33_00060 [Sphingobium sp. DEHP117]|uniref:hypothetical protein n=1 Tax=Sphingobium sp. DEHP117 TaxID=2993436 RepID=UPI0027D64256|nr:hypothetical protein [Sphingobium sp. DEHP117]MDQ4418840.1 hypothetical protein [Sphingobium sp. DEHP117]